jgi:hypothetical protein
LLVKLSPYEQKNFTNKHGVEIGKLQRKAGKEYCDVIDNLAQANKLENLRFCEMLGINSHLEYVESQTLVKRLFVHLSTAVDLKI